MIDACTGDCAAAPDDVVTLKKDGTLTYRGTEYTAEFSINRANRLTACITTDEGRIDFDFNAVAHQQLNSVIPRRTCVDAKGSGATSALIAQFRTLITYGTSCTGPGIFPEPAAS